MAERTVPTSARETNDQHEPTRSDERFVAPPVDIFEDDQGLVVVADLPGADPAGLDVRVERGTLTLQARTANERASGEPVFREFELTGFFRQFQLPDEVDPARIEAELKQGVLTLRLPRVAPAEPRRIQVKTAQ
jgi:HSP20 family molecular chaperone IbpA